MLNEKTQYFDTSKKILNLIPKNGIIAEIGVLRGEFSTQINILCNPKKLFLIDCWEEQDDEKYLLDTYNEGDEQTHEENYINVLKTFINKDNVKIIKANFRNMISNEQYLIQKFSEAREKMETYPSNDSGFKDIYK